MTVHPIVQKLTELRAREGINRSDAARRISIRRENLWRYETGRATPGLEILTAWAAVFGLRLRID